MNGDGSELTIALSNGPFKVVQQFPMEQSSASGGSHGGVERHYRRRFTPFLLVG